MKETIFLLNNDKQLVEMTEAKYLTEDELQTLLEDYPNLMSGDQIDEDNPRRWLLISREMGVADSENAGGRWSLDHLFIDQDGIPTLVEVKRSTDTRIRREVIGQMLDYAANAISYWKVEEIIAKFQSACQRKDKDPEEVLHDFLIDSDADDFWERVKTNLGASRIRLLLIADMIPREMKRIIEFLNEQMTTCTILGIEIKQFAGQGLKTLVPRVIGATEKAQQQKSVRSTGGEQWNQERFFAEIRTRDPSNYDIYKKIFDESSQLFNDVWWGTGTKYGSFIPNLRINKLFIQLFAVHTNGTIEIQFQHLKTKQPFDNVELRRELYTRLNSALNIKLDNMEGRPGIKPELFRSQETMSAFFEVVKWYIKEVKAFYGQI